MRKSLFLLYLIVIIICSPLDAALYYVDYKDGSDTNQGTAISATWKHCPGDSMATNIAGTVTLNPGDKIFFKGGVPYLGTVNIKWSGADGNPIVYDGNSAGTWGQGKSIIDGEGSTLGINARRYGFVSSAHYMGAGVTRKGNSYITIDNFEIRNLRYYDVESGDGPLAVYFDGKGQNATVSNCWIHSVKKRPTSIGIEIGQVSVDNLTLSDNQRDFTQLTSTQTNSAKYKVQLGWQPTSGTWDDYQFALGFLGEGVGANQVKVYKDPMLKTPGWADNGWSPLARTKYFYWIFSEKEGSFSNAGGVGISMTGYDNIQIANNSISETRIGINISSDADLSCNTVVVQGNDLSAVSIALWISTAYMDISNVQIKSNTFHDFYPYTQYLWGYHDNGMMIYTKNGGSITNLDISRNKFLGDMRPDEYTAMVYIEGPVDGGTISSININNNLFAISTGLYPYIRLNSGNNQERLLGVNILNNTFACVPGVGPQSITATAGPVNLNLRNNIFYLFYAYSACFGVDAPASKGFSSDYNLLHTAIQGGWSPVVYNGRSYTFSQWDSAGFDKHSIISKDPMFLNTPNFGVQTTPGAGTVNRIYYNKIQLAIPTTFSKGDHVEWDNDGIVRTVVTAGDGYIDVNPPLSNPPQPLPNASKPRYQYVLNWKGSSNFTRDYRVQSASPVIDAGTNLAGQMTAIDIDGVSRPQGACWDIGAYERAKTNVSKQSHLRICK